MKANPEEQQAALLDGLQVACDRMATLLRSRQTGHGMWWIFFGEQFRDLKAAITAIENEPCSETPTEQAGALQGGAR